MLPDSNAMGACSEAGKAERVDKHFFAGEEKILIFVLPAMADIHILAFAICSI